MRGQPGYEKLKQYQERGFVFHGSTRDGLEVLQPHKPRDAGDDPWNKDEAVYATTNPALAIPFALRQGYTGVFTVTTDTDTGEVTATFNAVFRDVLASNRGYVYVFDGALFPERKGLQGKSYQEVIPVDVVEVTLEDFVALGGRIVFVQHKHPSGAD
ncbi:MAG: hypothetical protein ACOX35_00145 [Bacillota bacterium]|nr:hypothetical protein [Bacillota bacterium]